MRFSVGKRRRMPFIVLVSILLCTIIIGTFWMMETHLKPTLLAIAETKATFIATQSINQVISDRVNLNIDPQTLMNVTLDSRGRVVLIQPNTMEFNKIAADTTIKVQDKLKEISEEKINIPIGQIFGSQLLASMGPNITVTIIPVGTVQVKVIDKFEQAGINQTRHMIYLIATTQIRIVVPLVSKSISVDTQMPIAEYVVVGDVPNTYVQFPFPFPNNLSENEKHE
ncbi:MULTISPECIES: sporulation protein YunB [Pelosinus]|uniref:Sporulation protein YunB n=1 Tax=Pelosinus fermentans B4 TaxID=1149862 RepID=I8RE77_9FIRM|nr:MULTISPECIES: sporulation protein YunB [Pelosinus]EIW17663.1 sporulation protein YunB [Pelosinus fermentans B4]EIW23624.1 sporulation protein YunB [Pelosinus fermentans A11]OAM94549.1 sporulation protein YunB [Pelosinus fermentans DSM 17108]SDR12014.1 sporulation protein YunB [Pelosinus fermentans]